MRYATPQLTLVGEAKGVVMGGTSLVIPETHKPDVEADIPDMVYENRF